MSFELSLAIAFLVFILRKTDFIYEYLSLFGFGSPKYDNWQTLGDNYKENYLVYLRETRPSFLTRLISCPICLSVFLHFGLFLIILVTNPFGYVLISFILFLCNAALSFVLLSLFNWLYKNNFE